ncbi:MAG: hypothetical protein K2Q20_04685, partial [Phycisphaerales bacterium]|nr:hypothetical protein [Phycisphaerales bacterium]
GAGISDPTAGLDPLGVGDAEPWPGAGGLLGGAVAATHEVVYFARNRFYSPGLNRWTAADPNAMGVPVLGSLWWGGSRPHAPDAAFDLTSHYADGMRVHSAYAGDPLGEQDPRGLSIVGVLSGGFMTQAVRATAATRATFGAIEGVRFMMAQHLATHYARYAVVAEFGTGAVAGDAVAGNPSVMLYKSVSSLAARNTDELFEFTSDHFRRNLARLTASAADMTMLSFFDAHHWIPQTLSKRVADLGVNVHNPLFGVWIERGDHQLLHRGPNYLKLWQTKVGELETAGIRGDAAIEEIAEFIKREVAPTYGLPVPW